uniref:Gnk2-homologous domain-containing protein n=1 Tax=Ananas comosus var. bracteatus TaxID=296719 RepID=A0A6V7NKR3_ANACO|nr:unnamed protein product [Ananas comosus var. bracteatus]
MEGTEEAHVPWLHTECSRAWVGPGRLLQGHRVEYYKHNGWEVFRVRSEHSHSQLLQLSGDTLLRNLADSVASKFNSGKLFATGELTIKNGFPTIYGSVQCAPDMLGPECRQCLQVEIKETLNVFDGRQGGRILGVRCTLRYEV